MIISEISIEENPISGDCATLIFYLHCLRVLVFTLGLNNNQVFLKQTWNFFGNKIPSQFLDLEYYFPSEFYDLLTKILWSSSCLQLRALSFSLISLYTVHISLTEAICSKRLGKESQPGCLLIVDHI